MIGGLRKTGVAVMARRAMRRHLGRQFSGGFTIIEVLIVLAVSGALFVSAVFLVNGRQSQTGFDQAIQQVQSQIQQVINEVSIGYFPDTNFRCVAGGSGPDISASASNGQGTNSGCIFVGKAMQFKVAGAAVPERFAVHTIAGLQQTSGGNESSTLVEAQPKVVAPSTAESTLPSLTTFSNLQSGLTTTRMLYRDTADHAIGEVAFVSSLASYDSGSITSGTQQVKLVPVFGTALSTAVTAGVDAIDGTSFRDPLKSPPNPSGGVLICFASGGTDQSGLITIGGTNRDLAVTLVIKSGTKTCGLS